MLKEKEKGRERNRGRGRGRDKVQLGVTSQAGGAVFPLSAGERTRPVILVLRPYQELYRHIGHPEPSYRVDWVNAVSHDIQFLFHSI